jgi:ribosomal protein S18
MKDRKVTGWLRPLSEAEIQELPFERYFYVSTLYLFAQLICWIEILKREQTYLDFTSTEETRTFNAYINLLYAVLSSPGFSDSRSDRTSKDHWIFFHYLSGLGEAMAQKSDSGGLSCISFRELCMKYKENPRANKKWFDEVERLVVDLSNDKEDLRWNRIQILWFCLDRFLDLVDPGKIRTTRDRTLSAKIDERLKNAAIRRAKKLGIALI